MYDQETFEEAVRLRKKERLSLKKIAERLKISQSTASGWLRKYPLRKSELKERMSKAGGSTKGKKNKNNLRNCDSSHLYGLVAGKLKRHQKAKVSEAAVTLRLLLQGCSVYSSVFDGDKFDCVVATPKGKLLKVQVKSTRIAKHGNPIISTTCSDGRGKHRPYRKEEVDIFVAYDLYLDRAYVYTFAEVRKRKGIITVSLDAEERWDKLL
jgi:transcriptional regulator with XRE-family HTH domain